MGSVLVKGMDMPKACGNRGDGKPCDFLTVEADELCGSIEVCRALKPQPASDHSYFVLDGFEFGKSRSPHCPLAPVPTPHGRLIDVDELMKYELQAILFPKGREENIDVWTNAVAIGDVMSAETVIEAEE